MSQHKTKITTDREGNVYAQVVRVDRDGEESVEFAKHYSTEAKARKAAERFIAAR